MAKGWKRVKQGIEEATGVSSKSKKRFRVRRMVAGKSFCQSYESLEEAEEALKFLTKGTKKFGKLTAKYLDVDWREYEEAKRHLPPGVSLVEAAIFYRSRNVVADRPDCFEVAVEKFLAEKRANGNVGERQIGHLESAMRELKAHWGGLSLDAVTTKIAKDVLLGMRPQRGARTIRNYFTNWKTFFLWMERQQYIDSSPLRNITTDDLPKLPPSKKNPLSVEQVRAMMLEVEENWSKWALWHALQLFAGFRISEANRFQIEWIKAEERIILLPLSFYNEESEREDYSVKTQDAWRLVDLPDNFWLWYESYKGEQTSGTIPHPNDHRWYYDLRPALLKAIGVKTWPDNARRDSFCTFHISLHQSAEKTALLLKHRSTNTLWKSYLGTMVPRNVAMDYFSIVPSTRLRELRL
ncbi:hypothetical protein [Pelagicoccus albus]|uniref:Tyr recombinase domain-containing protein n=1 Tax=Pelagicoccus albus TaxID=415222 RepID=A0A7X1B590_9BACT|nr:hypothetical protein [Pelagicoccus albus]MBC2605634.1 hypothetical protein [Pelagicoccus albus]